jgi:hypothetical protein
MAGGSITELLDAVSSAKGGYNKLVIIAGPSGSGKTRVLIQLADRLNMPVVNLSLKMSERLLPLTKRQRSLKAEEIALDVIDEQNESSACVDNTELLFDSSLRMNPLIFLQDISRNRLIISTWNGTYDGKSLSFGYAGHPDFFRQVPSGYPVVSVSDNQTRGV